MKKWTTLLLLASLELHGWGRSMENQFQQENAAPQPIFVINEEQQWFVENSYLLMRPCLENLDFANVVKEKHPSSIESDLDIKIKKPDFSWNSGVRLIIGKYLPHHDHWDISAAMTYFYGDATEKTHANPEHSKGLTPTYSSINNEFVFISADKLRGSWNLNYFTWDLALAREVPMTTTITFHPFITLRALLTYQDYDVKSSRIFHQGVQQNTSSNHFTARNRYWGVGPRIGTHLGYYIKNHWSILGQLSGALVYGPYENHIRGTATTLGVRSEKRAKDSDAWLRGNLEGFIGLGWDAWFQNQTIRIFPQLLFEGTLWWDMNRYFEPATLFSQSHGALSLMGLSFNLQIDF